MEVDALRFAGTTFAALLPIVNPLNAVPLFAVMTADFTDAERKREGTRAGLYAGAILLVTAVAGTFIMRFFGISLGMIQIAGGLIVGQAAWAMATGNPQVSRTETSTWAREQRLSLRRVLGRDREHARDSAPEPQPPEPRPPEAVRDIAFSPIGIPILAGPAAMGVILGLTSRADGMAGQAGILVGIALITALCVVGLRGSGLILRALGASGILAFQRIFGFILLAIAVALVANGISALFDIPITT